MKRKEYTKVKETRTFTNPEGKEYTINYEVGLPKDEYGYFEIWDEETGGNRWYSEGGLWFDGKTLRDYDGISELPKAICDILDANGCDASYAR